MDWRSFDDAPPDVLEGDKLVVPGNVALLSTHLQDIVRDRAAGTNVQVNYM